MEECKGTYYRSRISMRHVEGIFNSFRDEQWQRVEGGCEDLDCPECSAIRSMWNQQIANGDGTYTTDHYAPVNGGLYKMIIMNIRGGFEDAFVVAYKHITEK
jgi:hypothetical protein